MGTKLVVICLFIGWIATARGQGLSALCQRFPNNPNCGSSSAASSNSRPVDPTAMGLPPPPNQAGSQPAPSSGSANSDPCSSWRPVYDKYCVGATIDAQYQTSCAQFQQTCVGGANGGGLQSGGPVNPSAAGLPPPPSNGQPQPQPQPQGTGAGSTWNALTEKAQAEQAQQALANAQNGQYNCPQFQQNYNVWCGGVRKINEVYCNTLGRACQQQASQLASGQQQFGAPFQGGGVGGGAGSTRPLSIGNNIGVGPFANIGRNVGINPLKGLSTDRGVDIPIAGLGFHRTAGIDWGGLPGVAQAGAALGRRRRRWAIPVGVDHFGNVVYVLQ